MKDLLLVWGFRSVGKCSCSGGLTDNYEHPAFANWRVTIGTANFAIKQKVTARYATVHHATKADLHNSLTRYFPI